MKVKKNIELKHDMIDNCSSSIENGNIFKELNPSQLKAVLSPIGRISLVYSGPGAGKTRVLTSRIAYLMDNSREKSKVLAVTFTKKAATEMGDRLHSLIEKEKYKNRITVGTFHSICTKILRWHGKKLRSIPYVENNSLDDDSNLDGSFSILDTKDQMKIIKELIKKQKDIPLHSKTDIDYKKIQMYFSKILRTELHSDLIMISDTTSSNSEKRKYDINEKIVREIYPIYLSRIFSLNALDFDHLIILCVLLLKNFPDIQKELHGKWEHILVDEFQDTSPIQFTLVHLLCRKSLMVVGDADQSIYSWRGAHVNSMNDFMKYFKEVETFNLMENYRSTKNIISAAQRVINLNKNKKHDYLSRPKIIPMKGSGPPVRIVKFEDNVAEADFVVRNILQMIESSQITSNSTVAVMYRTSAQSRILEERCISNRLRYRIVGSIAKFYSRAEVQDCLCFLRLLNNGNDRLAFIRAVKTPKGKGIGSITLNEFWDYCEEVKKNNTKLTFMEILLQFPHVSVNNLSTRSRKSLGLFSKHMNQFIQDCHNQTLPDLFQNMLAFWELQKQVESISSSKLEFTNRWSNVLELRFALEKYRNDGPCMNNKNNQDEDAFFENSSSPLSKFLDNIALLMEDEADSHEIQNDNNIIVNLMTIHAAKGMEFDTVFLVGNEEGTFPTHFALSDEKESNKELIEEEGRLCFVAMTRAKSFLFLTWRKKVKYFSPSSKFPIEVNREKSRFLKTLTTKKNKKSIKQKKDLDSTFFFPHGSHVVHRVHGTGIVLPSHDEKENHVYVQFDSGISVHFPLLNSGLRHRYASS